MRGWPGPEGWHPSENDQCLLVSVGAPDSDSNSPSSRVLRVYGVRYIVARMNKVKIPTRTCLRCGYTWAARQPTTKNCANKKCKSPYWDKPRRSQKVAPESK